jgi:radical SAM superfamily enzyme
MSQRNQSAALPYGYFAEHDAWEHRPAIIAFHQLDMNKPMEQFTQTERDIIATAYTQHDQHFGHTLEDKLRRYRVTMLQICESIANEIGSHVKSTLAMRPDLLENAVLGNLQEIMESYQVHPWWINFQGIEAELQERINRGLISDLQTYYNYMCQHHLVDVLGEGW